MQNNFHKSFLADYTHEEYSPSTKKKFTITDCQFNLILHNVHTIQAGYRHV